MRLGQRFFISRGSSSTPDHTQPIAHHIADCVLHGSVEDAGLRWPQCHLALLPVRSASWI